MSNIEGPAGPDLQDAAVKARQLEQIPLFMRSLPQNAASLNEDASLQLEALQSLLYEGDAEGEAGLHFRTSKTHAEARTMHCRASAEL